ncbi:MULTISPECIES: c-type cytochrome [Paenibacillus]|uniref:c-type cytochrome n=1 Tax=Paenibacillus TaxID=44249 RepID=UPI0013DB0CCA|nr:MULTISPECIES: cytochrome c [Paenibacillus]MCY7485089.1 cytochrome c [Paenibacillus alvei]NEZ40107.1 c-type cytochrome [Paenibacillus alvei]
MPKRRMYTRFMPIIAGIALLGLLAGCGGGASGGNESSSGNAKESAALEGPEEVVTLYKNNCMQCHGTEMQGMMGPESNLQKIGSKLTKDEIANTIENGGKLMPAQGGRLEKEEIDKIADWLASKK